MRRKKMWKTCLVSLFSICLLLVTGCGKPSHTEGYLAAEREFNEAYEQMQILLDQGITPRSPCSVYHPYKIQVNVAIKRFDRSIGNLKYAAYAEGNETDKAAYDSDKIHNKMQSGLRSDLYDTITGGIGGNHFLWQHCQF